MLLLHMSQKLVLPIEPFRSIYASWVRARMFLQRLIWIPVLRLSVSFDVLTVEKSFRTCRALMRSFRLINMCFLVLSGPAKFRFRRPKRVAYLNSLCLGKALKHPGSTQGKDFWPYSLCSPAPVTPAVVEDEMSSTADWSGLQSNAVSKDSSSSKGPASLSLGNG